MSKLNDKELQAYLDEVQEEALSSYPLSAEAISLEHLKESEALEDVEIPELDLEGTEIVENIPRIQGPVEFKYEARKKIERETVNEALNQTYLDLNSFISASDKQTLIAILVNEYTVLRDKYKLYIDKVFNKVFRKFIPVPVINMWIKYPDMFVPFPGFNYQCSDKFGKSKSYWVNLMLPMYFRPEICESLFKANGGSDIFKVERAIERYHTNKQLKIANEVKHARALAGISTYYMLLEKKPYWYYLLINYLKEKNGWSEVQARPEEC